MILRNEAIVYFVFDVEINVPSEVADGLMTIVRSLCKTMAATSHSIRLQRAESRSQVRDDRSAANKARFQERPLMALWHLWHGYKVL
jgi:hypothetical protein